jgi:hypothetical protein
MIDALAEIRTRLHQKSHDYFIFEYSRRDRKSWRMFYGATDALLDASMAASAFSRSVRNDLAVDLLVCYGFLQALYIQQGAVWTLSRAVGLSWHPNEDLELKKIRDVRNRLTGHPAYAGEKERPARLSSAIISYRDIMPEAFTGVIYFEDNAELITVDVIAFLRENEARLSLQMQNIEAEMDRQEREFRANQSVRPLSDNFGRGFSYLLEKLRCDFDDESRVIQAETHVKMIREIIEKLKKDLAEREFEPTDAAYHVDLIFVALDFMEQTLSERRRAKRDRDMYDVVLDGFQNNLDQLMATVAEIDTRLNTAV